MLTFREAVHELYKWRFERASVKAELLYNLIHKANPQRRQFLRAIYPNFVCAYEAWLESENDGSTTDLFEKYGVSEKPPEPKIA